MEGNKDMKYIANCSFGKDSLAMILRLIAGGYPLDEVIFYDTEMEFQAIYNNRDKLSEILKEKGIKFTVIKNELPFTYRAFEKEIKTKSGLIKHGFNWCGARVRWNTNGKLSSINKYYKETYGKEIIIEYIGIAADESVRVEKSRVKRQKTVKLYPLVEWGMTEKDCLQYCYSQGWNWSENGYELYDLLDRVSCWCCANKNQKELRNIYRYLPEYWEKLKWYEDKCQIPYKKKGIKYFEEKFDSMERKQD